MSAPVQFIGVGIAGLGVAYITIPRKIYRFGFDFLRNERSDHSEPSDTVVWLYRCLGVCLLVVSVSYPS